MTTPAHQPKLILHGGAGRALRDPSRKKAVEIALLEVIDEVWAALLAGASAPDAVRLGCQRLEDDPLFNAGTGSVVQSDGQIRMSASLMDGQRQSFSAVINAQRVRHPIDLAFALQHERDRVLAELGAQELARRLAMPIHDPMTPRRLREWLKEYDDSFELDAAEVVAAHGSGTIGVVALDTRGQLAAGTSTGGRGFEHPGRVSDSATPAGNYADAMAAVSCTGVGEHILDECLAARLVVRVNDGLSLGESFARSLGQAHARGRNLGAIGLDHRGHLAWGKTSDLLIAAYHDGRQVRHTLDLPLGLTTGYAAG